MACGFYSDTLRYEIRVHVYVKALEGAPGGQRFGIDAIYEHERILKLPPIGFYNKDFHEAVKIGHDAAQLFLEKTSSQF